MPLAGGKITLLEIQALQDGLAALLRDDPQWGAARPGPLRYIARGWESEIYAFTLDDAQPADGLELVMRLYPGDRAVEVARREFEALQKLHAAGYPVPQPHRLALDSPFFEQPLLLMAYVPGRPMWDILGSSPPLERERLLRMLAERLAELHHLDWQRFNDQRPADPYFWLDRWLAEVTAISRQLDLGPFQPALAWLQQHRDRVPCHRPAPVHWDYHPGNLIVTPEGGAVVLDWTQFQVSDPRFDLAWCLLLLEIYEGPAVRQRVHAHYQDAWGEDTAGLGYFDAAVAFKRLGSIYISLSQGPERLGMRAGASQSIRSQGRAAQAVYARLQANMGLRLPGVEAFLDQAFDS